MLAENIFVSIWLYCNNPWSPFIDMQKITRQKSAGFTLIEVLVSVFVLALGVIGVAGMQINAMRTSQNSHYQTVSVQMASALSDKMRANASVMNQVDGSNPFIFEFDAADGVSGEASACYSSNCNAAQMAVFDIQEWQTRLSQDLPGARAVVCRDTAPVSDGLLTWACTSSSAGVNLPMVIKIGWSGRGKNIDGSDNEDGNYPPVVALTVESYVNPEQADPSSGGETGE